MPRDFVCSIWFTHRDNFLPNTLDPLKPQEKGWDPR